MLICLTGPECSGKTTLANFLAQELDVVFVEEYAREYLGTTNGQYRFEDLDIIAKGQVNLVRRAGYGIGSSEYLPGDTQKYSDNNRKQGSFNRINSETESSEAEGAELESEASVVITDTFLLVILIWSLHKFGKVSESVKALYSEIQPDLYLLCRPDLPWEQDALRESPHEREVLFEKYLEQVMLTDIPYFIVEGSGDKRMQTALKSTQSFFQKKLP